MEFYVDLDMKGNTILNMGYETFVTDPVTPHEGQRWYNSTQKRFKYYDGTSIQVVPSQSTTDTFTNKTFDANATGNSITNLEVDDFAAGEVETTLTGSSNVLADSNAIQTAINSAITTADVLRLIGNIDCSTNPNYPAADNGHTYKVSVAGKIGGAAGPDVNAGDLIVCQVDSSPSGDHATVGSNWFIIEETLADATETVPGKVRMATDAEAKARTLDSNVSVDPANLNDFSRTWARDFTSQTGETITAATHGLKANKYLHVSIYRDGSPNRRIYTRIFVYDNGDVQWVSNNSISGYIVISD